MISPDATPYPENSLERSLQRRARSAELEPQIIKLAGEINAADYRFLKLLAEFDDNHGWWGDGIKSFAHWLNYMIGLNEVVAREKVRVARALTDLPLIDEAFRLGKLSYSKVRAITRIGTPNNQDFLLMIAEYGTASHIEHLARKYRLCQRLDAEVDPDELWKKDRAFYYRIDEDGMYLFEGRLPAEEGAVIIKAIDMMRKAIRRERGDDPEQIQARIMAQRAQQQDDQGESQSRTDIQSEPRSQKDQPHIQSQSQPHFQQGLSQQQNDQGEPQDQIDQTQAEPQDQQNQAQSQPHDQQDDLSHQDDQGEPQSRIQNRIQAEPHDQQNQTLSQPQDQQNQPQSQLHDQQDLSQQQDDKELPHCQHSTGNENASQNVSAETFIQDINPPDILDDQASALTQLAEHYLETANMSSPHTSLSEKYQVLLHINANEAHVDHQINQGDICHVENNKFLSREVARQLACDTHMRVVLEDDDGKILNIGRKSRTIPRAIAHALNIRDGGCRYPGCTQHFWTDAHHVRHWAAGGETKLDNLITLCRFHHTQLHKDVYEIQVQDQDFVFINQDKEEILRSIHPQFPVAEADDRVQSMLKDQAHIGIDANTAETKWRGDAMDIQMALHVAFDAERDDVIKPGDPD